MGEGLRRAVAAAKATQRKTKQMPEPLAGPALARAADTELNYALAQATCDAHEVRRSAKKLGVSPALWFRLAIVVGAIFAKLKALAAGKPIIQTLHAFGQDAWIAAGIGAPPQIPGA